MTRPGARAFGALALLALAGCAPASGALGEVALNAPDRAWAESAAASQRSGKTFPGLTLVHPAASLAQAYAAQRHLVALSYSGSGGGAGFKGGFSSPEALARFGIEVPAVGVLPTVGRLSEPYVLRLDQFNHLLIECEIGFELGRDIHAPLADDEQTRSAVAMLGPAMEFPDIRLEDAPARPLADQVAANISAARFAFLPKVSPERSGNLDTLRVTLSRDGKRLLSDTGSKAFGNQWEALRLIINGVIANGYRPRKGDVVLTGSIVQIEAEKGAFHAEFGNLGTFEFQIR